MENVSLIGQTFVSTELSPSAFPICSFRKVTSHARCHGSNTYGIDGRSFKGSLSLPTDVGEGAPRILFLQECWMVHSSKKLSLFFSFKLFPLYMWMVSWEEVLNEK